MWRSLVAYVFWVLEVAGSNPVIPILLDLLTLIEYALSSVGRT